MSWFTRSIANTLNLTDPQNDQNTLTEPQNDQNTLTEASSSASPRGVKDDLSELTQTLTRQFWGVASFLSPPSQPALTKDSNRSSDEDSDDVGVSGIRSDLEEIGGKFRSGISKISENINVSDFTKIASNLMKLAVDGVGDDDEEVVVGVTEEVVEFVEDLVVRPENWLDFPLPEEEDEDGFDFDMTDAQQEHALAVERLAPRLAALRMELCPEYMRESCFWMIYFVLLHPKLGKEDAIILSTPQIMDYRAMLVAQLKKESKQKLDNKSGEVDVDLTDISTAQHEESPLVTSGAISEHAPEKSFETDIQIVEESAISSAAADYVSEKHAIASTGIHIVDKSVIEVERADHNRDQNVHSSPSNTWENRDEDEDEDDVDDWLKDETTEIGCSSGATVPIENDEDVSFSDFEDDEEDAISNLKNVNYISDKDSPEWVQL